MDREQKYSHLGKYKLKPCPFCGDKGAALYIEEEGELFSFCACSECDCAGPMGSTKQAAIDLWNNRVIPPKQFINALFERN
jgi:Lar family restriction alleviation protein